MTPCDWEDAATSVTKEGMMSAMRLLFACSVASLVVAPARARG